MQAVARGDHERAFLGLVKDGGPRSVDITDLVASRQEFKSNPFSGRLFELFSEVEEEGKIGLDDYKACLKRLDSKDMDDKHDLAFMAYDVDGDGFISEGDLYFWMRRLGKGERQSSKQIHQVAKKTIEAYDKDEDGKLSPEEFKPLLSDFALADYFGL
ncbi:hypothetical protein HOP50_16g77330 [Chloropicon primus]|uniref:EF-hand domain-containing protein n=1 Tax=Chloropicon primus TaxID=1764295 RepID=A0A5B8MXD6_9CHLO|nr:hypothetical protein A3770_16p77050 [Chloropicon primus]UPR04392.1 hypothetical protein HOP50_16g77330 [Chloropicon primus]|eukprot:QDZ25187.1 hypothetical protein A3770_16p77050 [Chloropicon primus]